MTAPRPAAGAEPAWLAELAAARRAWADDDLLRTLRDAEPAGRQLHVDGRALVNLASNDYLALSSHPRLIEAAVEAIRRWGVGSGASRLVAGTLPIHSEVERKFAAFKHAEAALLCPTGFMANLAAITSLAGPGDLVCLDKLCHASLIDAARASGATVRVFPHLGYDKLRRLLATRTGRAVILTDSVFSMDGDVADLPVLCDVAREHEAILIVDEAHGTGVLGEHGTGLCESQGVSDRVDVVISTASKAMGGLGGIITARQIVIDAIVNRGRSFIYTTAIPPGQAAAIGAAATVITDEPWRRQRVLQLSARVRQTLGLHGTVTPIIPVVTGSAASALQLSTSLREAGFFAPAIRPPTVAPGKARVRLSLRADLEDADIDRLLDAWHDRHVAAG